ncbi:MAG: UPF0147 family protein [Candidatus Heimdallarchaeota archaeon]|nr:UPF0147 family protein [Candidatus Heimdallarchaeota archaeon]MDH5644613.1 UPF0147 family protein [Candidatus Heimdallarchaeota archaeon]
MSSSDDQIKEAIEILTQISEDQSVPRNIRRTAIKSVETLNDKEMDIAVRAINAIELLEDSTSDPNCPFHCRTMLWQAITRLELPGEDDDDEWEYYDEEDEDYV